LLLWRPKEIRRVWPPSMGRGPLADRRRKPADEAQQDQQAATGKTRPTDLVHSLQASVSLTGTLVRRPGSVSSPASGMETRPSGVCKPCG
jgi:hypothetical protein